MADHQDATAKGTAALLRIISLRTRYEAAVIMDDAAEAEAIRDEAHDQLDAFLDRAGEAAIAVKAILERR